MADCKALPRCVLRGAGSVAMRQRHKSLDRVSRRRHRAPRSWRGTSAWQGHMNPEPPTAFWLQKGESIAKSRESLSRLSQELRNKLGAGPRVGKNRIVLSTKRPLSTQLSRASDAMAQLRYTARTMREAPTHLLVWTARRDPLARRDLAWNGSEGCPPRARLPTVFKGKVEAMPPSMRAPSPPDRCAPKTDRRRPVALSLSQRQRHRHPFVPPPETAESLRKSQPNRTLKKDADAFTITPQSKGAENDSPYYFFPFHRPDGRFCHRTPRGLFWRGRGFSGPGYIPST